MKKSIINAVIIGIMSAIAVQFTSMTTIPTWVLFVGWVSFYLFGQAFKTMLFSYLQILLGITLAVIISVLGGYLLQFHATGTSIAIFIMMTVFILIVTNLKTLNQLPAYFLGLIVFFGVHPELNLPALLTLAATIASGFVFAWITANVIRQSLGLMQLEK